MGRGGKIILDEDCWNIFLFVIPSSEEEISIIFPPQTPLGKGGRGGERDLVVSILSADVVVDSIHAGRIFLGMTSFCWILLLTFL